MTYMDLDVNASYTDGWANVRRVTHITRQDEPTRVQTVRYIVTARNRTSYLDVGDVGTVSVKTFLRWAIRRIRE